MDTVWVLWWKYSDGSGQGIIRAYEDEQRAKDDFALVEESTDRTYMLDHVPLFEDMGKPKKLPTVTLGGKTYFIDRRLKQLRNVENPHDYVDFKE